MKKKKTFYTGLGILLVSLVLTGCSSEVPDDFPRLHNVTLEFTQEGKPMTEAEIYLVSADDACPWCVTGTTNNKGQAELYTHGQYKGAPEGVFRVIVQKQKSEGEKEITPEEQNSLDDSVQKEPIYIYSLVDKKYTTKETTPLEVTIQKGSNYQPFELGKEEKVLMQTIKPGQP
ncbi:MAG: hypothetical protein Q4G68_01630 [Planctomycetia bacterium]|nr:hypothetical protein [Planctomycetia bacterium]